MTPGTLRFTLFAINHVNGLALNQLLQPEIWATTRHGPL